MTILGGVDIMKRLEVYNIARDIQDKIIDFVYKVNVNDIGCMSRDIEADGTMLLFYDTFDLYLCSQYLFRFEHLFVFREAVIH